MDLELIQFPFSTFNEKARWALDYKGLPRTDRFLLPGPHAAYVSRRTGQTSTPALRSGDAYVTGSGQIIAWLEETQPDPRLLPADPSARDAALMIQARFDEDWGPRSRRGILAIIARRPFYLARMFGNEHGAATRLLYGAMWPLVRKKFRRANGIHSQADVDDGLRAVDEMLDYVAETSAATGYLVGDGFSVADLTAASFIAPVADPPDSPMTRPRPVPAMIKEWQEAHREHPGIRWTLEMYRRHRRPVALKEAA